MGCQEKARKKKKKKTKFKLKTSAATWVSKMQILLHPDAINQYLNAKNPNTPDNQTGDTFDALQLCLPTTVGNQQTHGFITGCPKLHLLRA